MKLSEVQIQELYKFTRKHFVEHYDLQTELVDHLANGIEQQWKETPNVTFEEAQRKEFKKFGVCGFHDVIKDRRKAMAKKYRKYIFRYYKEYFCLPKVLKLIVLAIGLFFLLQLIYPEYKFIAITAFTFVIGCVFIWYNRRNQNKYQNKIGTTQKRWMMEGMIANLGDAGSMGIFPMYLFNTINSGGYQLKNVYIALAICAIICSYLILCYVIVFSIPQKAEELLTEAYPEYKTI